MAGSGRSGTSLVAGILQRLGYAVPGPEVPADETNPRGFAESQWVVDFHAKLLKKAGVQVADARPSGWSLTAKACVDQAAIAELREWLAAQLAAADHLIVKDPRISWFAPLWRRCADELGAPPRFVTMLRHPAEVIDSKQRWYGGRQGEISRAAGWINQTLFTERATRDAPRAFIRYDDLLADWTREVVRAEEALDLGLVRSASPAAMRSVHEFVDRDLRRSRADWEGLSLPETLRAQAEEVWQQASRLAAADAPAEVLEQLDALRAAYGDFYAEAEAIAHSSIAAARGAAARPAHRRLRQALRSRAIRAFRG